MCWFGDRDDKDLFRKQNGMIQTSKPHLSLRLFHILKTLEGERPSEVAQKGEMMLKVIWTLHGQLKV